MHYIAGGIFCTNGLWYLYSQFTKGHYLYFILFNTFWLETKFWEAHRFWDSGATCHYNLVFLPQNITKNSVVFDLLNYSAYSLFFPFKRPQNNLFHFLARYLPPFTSPLSSQEGISSSWFCCFTNIQDQLHVHCVFWMTLKWHFLQR